MNTLGVLVELRSTMCSSLCGLSSYCSRLDLHSSGNRVWKILSNLQVTFTDKRRLK